VKAEGLLAPASSVKLSNRGLQVMRDIITLGCEKCKGRNYTTTKNKRKTPEKLVIKKYCPTCRTHTVHKETK